MTQPADDDARLGRVLLKAEKLTASRLADMRSEAEQGRCSSFRMLWLLDAFDSLLRLLDEARAERDALAAKLAKAREVLEAIDWNEMSGAEAPRVAHNACVVLDDTGGPR